MKRMRGFTLLEVLVATVIIILLTTVGVASYANISKRSRDARRSSDIEQLRSALEMYRSDFGNYPNVGGGSWVSVSNLNGVLVPTYIQRIPSDPRGITYPYQYRATNQNGGRYYGYCLALRFESQSGENNCGSITLPNSDYNYGLRHP